MCLISVVVCTHNPRTDYIQKVLDALRAQDCDLEDWELIVVDNQSTVPLSGKLDLAWNRRARVVVESQLGLTPARIRGINESTAPVICFVDDDNVLAPDYLRVANEFGRRHQNIGAWGGSIEPVYESPAPEWLGPYVGMLAIRTVIRAQWTNIRGTLAPPSGAGLIVRREVALEYLKQVSSQPWKLGLDRKGGDLLSGGDSDLAYCAERLALGWGVFPELKVQHLIPNNRLQWSYVMRLLEGITTSVSLIEAEAGNSIKTFQPFERRIRWLYNRVFRGRRAADHFAAVERGKNRALLTHQRNSIG